jgi:hypothetical protein
LIDSTKVKTKEAAAYPKLANYGLEVLNMAAGFHHWQISK